MCSTETVTVDSSSSGGTSSGCEMSSTVGNGKLADSNNNHQRNPNRRSNKPIMEKRRRARINNCLNELKGILLEAMRKDPARHSKLEKADILELTVSHLKSLHRETITSPTSTAAELMARYRAGYAECAAEVSRFLASSKAEGIDPTSTARLMVHLNESLHRTTEAGALSPSLVSRTTPLPRLSTSVSTGPLSSSSGDTPMQSTPVISLVPSRLPSGEIAFVVPGFTSLRHGIQIQATPARYQPLLSPEVPLELTVSHQGHGPPLQNHYQQGSTSSPTSSTSSLSPAYAYAPMAHTQAHSSSFYTSQIHSSYFQNQSPQPLALVTPKRDMVDLSCWRPW